jgi:uncharacterized protein YerC
MPHVSRIKLDKKVEEKLINTLDLTLIKLTKEEEMKGFLTSLLTPTERLMLAKRLAMVILLKRGMSESKIRNTLKVTRATVDRMQLYLEVRGEGYDPVLSKLENEEIVKELKIILEKLANYSIRAAGGYVKF